LYFAIWRNDVRSFRKAMPGPGGIEVDDTREIAEQTFGNECIA
jgi:hypothetical protein